MRMDVLERLAILILSGELKFDALDQRLESCFESQRVFRHKLIHRLIEHFGLGSRPSIRAVKEWLSQDPPLRRKKQRGITLYPDSLSATMAADRSLSSDWKVPSICTVGRLANWLDISPEELDWFSGEMHFTSGSTKLCHYNYKTIAKRSGGMRLLEIPKWRLKTIQRRILHGILDRIPSHDCSHGFKKNRSIFTFTQPHKNKNVVLKFDLKDYFLSTERARVRSLFHLAGYPPTISRHLAGICCHQANPHHLPNNLKGKWLYERPHLPQGAPSSPALADKLLYRLDLRLLGLARKMALSFTRYADDIAFSSGKPLGNKSIASFTLLIENIISEEGWQVNPKKTRVMRQSQQQRLTGLVINQGTNLPRKEYDQIRAILHRCKQNGFEAENRECHPNFVAHLQGRIQFVLQSNQKRGEKLMTMLSRISLL